MRKIENKIATDVITKVYIENNKYYVIFYSNINYNYYTELYFNDLDFYDKTCNIIKIETCTKSNLLVYTCEVQDIDLLYDIRNCINANITFKPFGFRMNPGFSGTDVFKSPSTLSNLDWINLDLNGYNSHLYETEQKRQRIIEQLSKYQ